MINGKKIIAVIPARGGSKGIKLKNLKKINGKSLIRITAEFVHKCKFFDYATLSTDHNKISKEARKYKIDIVKRPKKLSGDKISDTKVLLHAVEEIEKFTKLNFDIVVMLHPTSPLRKINDVRNCIKMLIKKKYDSVWTISKTDSKFHPDKQLQLKKNKIKYYSKKGPNIFYRQQLDQVYYRNSNAYVIRKNFLKKKKTLFSKNTGSVIVKSKQISIDNLEDINFVKSLLK